MLTPASHIKAWKMRRCERVHISALLLIFMVDKKEGTFYFTSKALLQVFTAYRREKNDFFYQCK
ncbi:hypothetical protein YBT1520_02090 [Bacillus thuringiensis serovar kurstaki str. YBT-1520]|nr:hypothetical protein YBT1520_02090 [Bacillus thuringiensis serovar kurstaki str. YBT-1520]AIE31511.1 hypothetical protein BTK_01915 [Bacillus thuringiensis serovar kurstaki str. HD-1]